MNKENSYPSWGLIPKPQHQEIEVLTVAEVPSQKEQMLARGLGRSYGDSCLNEGGSLLVTKNLNHFISFEQNTGLLKCESGVTLDEILKVFVPKGWFLPVTPGTKFVTIGGAIANDVHGKNHHKAGNIGHHILDFELVRSDGARVVCSQEENADLFQATIGGLGLTGLISWTRIKLIPIKSSLIDQEQIKFSTFSEFMALSKESESQFDYTVAWVDCVNGKDLRGIFIRGNHSEKGPLAPHQNPKLTIPFNFPNWALNRLSISLFNQIYYGKNLKKIIRSKVHYDKFFYPLDSIHHWNRIYGNRGFYQYQFVVPFGPQGEQVLMDILAKIKKSGMASFLVVLKTFGEIPSLGHLSFPTAGITLALDFANFGEPLHQLLNECDQLLEQVGGRVYPAKDARMSESFFHKSYSTEKVRRHFDAKFSSSFSRRVHL